MMPPQTAPPATGPGPTTRRRALTETVESPARPHKSADVQPSAEKFVEGSAQAHFEASMNVDFVGRLPFDENSGERSSRTRLMRSMDVDVVGRLPSGENMTSTVPGAFIFKPFRIDHVDCIDDDCECPSRTLEVTEDREPAAAVTDDRAANDVEDRKATAAAAAAVARAKAEEVSEKRRAAANTRWDKKGAEKAKKEAALQKATDPATAIFDKPDPPPEGPESSDHLRATIEYLEQRAVRSDAELAELKKKLKLQELALGRYKKGAKEFATKLSQLQGTVQRMKTLREKAEQERKDGFAASDVEQKIRDGPKHTGSVDFDTARSTTHDRAMAMVRELLHRSKGDIVEGVDILRAFFGNKEVKRVMDLMTTLDPNNMPTGAAQNLVADVALLDRLAESVQKLKVSAKSLHEWHAYQAVLTAIAPDKAKGFAFKHTLERLGLDESTKALTAAVDRKRSIFELDEGGSRGRLLVRRTQGQV